MASDKPADQKPKGTNGTTLDIMIDDRNSLPHGLTKLRSGMIGVTQLYCPNGHNLIDESSAARFNGFPGIVVLVEGKETTGKVILSPIHGDDTKFGESDFELGEITTIKCPECGVELPKMQPCGCAEGAYLVGLYLDDKLEEGNQVAVCQRWGCLRSRIMDRYQVLSKFE